MITTNKQGNLKCVFVHTIKANRVQNNMTEPFLKKIIFCVIIQVWNYINVNKW